MHTSRQMKHRLLLIAAILTCIGVGLIIGAGVLVANFVPNAMPQYFLAVGGVIGMVAGLNFLYKGARDSWATLIVMALVVIALSCVALGIAYSDFINKLQPSIDPALQSAQSFNIKYGGFMLQECDSAECETDRVRRWAAALALLSFLTWLTFRRPLYIWASGGGGQSK